MISIGAHPLPATATEFIDSVLRLHPRIAVFDCDGTLWAGDSGEEFLYWEVMRGILAHAIAEEILPRYRDYKDGKVSEEAICGEMVTIHEGLTTAVLEAAAEDFFAERFLAAIFPEMLELVNRLHNDGCAVWAVSSTNEWVVQAGVRRFGIPGERVLAACVRCENKVATGRLWRVPTDEDKAVAVREVIAQPVDAVFGNSMHDAAMLALAKDAFAINPNPDLQVMAQEYGWRIYFPKIA
ncbi:MAG: haloacid dehalogenase-like hydrolase [Terriglobales bacterium]|jgi:phosphoserine phosphatase